MANILEVKNLKISFRTNSGTVKAVRDISFNLEKGETLAIVGESGSGKSVTSKAILGILAGNSIVENGEILYDGRDLLKITEEEMCKIRGDKISMIFQDPLSALDPIVKIGKQITEAMLLKNKTNRKRARAEFNSTLEALKVNMLESAAEAGKDTEIIPSLIETFDKFNILAIKLENGYNMAKANVEALNTDIKHLLYFSEKKQKLDVKKSLSQMLSLLKTVNDKYLIAGVESVITDYAAKLTEQRAAYKTPVDGEGKPVTWLLPAELESALKSLSAFVEELLKRPAPNFFRIGYYLYKNPEAQLDLSDIEKLNEMALEYLNSDFMTTFKEYEALAIRHSAKKSLEAKREVVAELKRVSEYFTATETLLAKETKAVVDALVGKVNASIDKLEYNKDNIAYTFESGIRNAVSKYFLYEKLNPKEEARFARQTAKREALIARGKKIDWKVVPKNVYDLAELREGIKSVLSRLYAKYESDIEAVDGGRDLDGAVVGLIDYLKERASKVVFKITKRMARDRALELMEEVGIPEPLIRYNQYPFEFSGGMRQRIVIAIALAANPDILICDEPTTALDVTIQSQILELINRLKAERGLSIIFITHDLGVVANMADRVAVMYAGKIVEQGTANDIFYDPRHPYTWALLSSMPDLDTNEKLDAIPGTPPNMIYPPVGDAFAARNKYALKIDFEEQPPMFKVSDTHEAATWLLHPDAPKVELPKIISDRIARMKKAGGEN